MGIAAGFFAAFFLIAGFAGVYLSLRREIRASQADILRKLGDMLRKGHGYSDPSAAAVVTEAPAPRPRATTLPTGEAPPVLARAASSLSPMPVDAPELEASRGPGLTVAMARPAGLPVRIVSVTRDDDAAHTRDTVELRARPVEASEHDDEGEEATRVMELPDRATILGMRLRGEAPRSCSDLSGDDAPTAAPLTPTKLSPRRPSGR